jgi:hypothetical protein
MPEPGMNPAFASERFARHALGVRFQDLPEDWSGGRVFILDTIGSHQDRRRGCRPSWA